MRMRRAGLGVMAAATLLLTVAACGDDDETVESGSDTTGGEVADGPGAPTPIEPGDGATLPEEPDQAELDATDDHRSAVYLFAADGRLLQRFRGTPVDEARLVDELTRLSARPS